MKKIGLYFGSFNPIHNTHTYIVEYLLEKKIVDEIQLIVSPFKQTYTKLYTLNKFKFLLLHRGANAPSPQSLISLNGRVFLNNFRPSLFIFFAAFKSL